jgi:hypothetical protein
LSETDIDFEDLSLDFIPPVFPEGVDQIRDDFEWLKDMDFANLGEIMGYEAFADSNSGHPEQLNSLDQRFLEAARSFPNTNTLVDAASQVTASQLDDEMDSIPGEPSLLTQSSLQPQLNQSLLADSSEGNQVSDRSEGTLLSGIMQHSIESTLSQQIPVPLQISMQTSMAPLKTQAPPLNTDEKLNCNYLGCSNIQFERKCDWQ